MDPSRPYAALNGGWYYAAHLRLSYSFLANAFVQHPPTPPGPTPSSTGARASAATRRGTSSPTSPWAPARARRRARSLGPRPRSRPTSATPSPTRPETTTALTGDLGGPEPRLQPQRHRHRRRTLHRRPGQRLRLSAQSLPRFVIFNGVKMAPDLRATSHQNSAAAGTTDGLNVVSAPARSSTCRRPVQHAHVPGLRVLAARRSSSPSPTATARPRRSSNR